MRVQNIISNKGNAIPNQFILTDDDGNEFFQSYQSIIIKLPKVTKDNVDNDSHKIQLDQKYWDYSVTIGKYRNIFLGEGIAETRKKIKSGEYTLTNLN